MRLLVVALLLLLPWTTEAGFVALLPSISSFSSRCCLNQPPHESSAVTRQQHQHQGKQQHLLSYAGIRTRRCALLDVPDNFFTILLPTLSLFLAFSKAVARSRLEERAWEQRLEEARAVQLEEDASLTELDLLRKEAAAEWSAYGSGNSGDGGEQQDAQDRRGRARRVMTKDDNRDDAQEARREFQMTREEVEELQEEFGVEYDPHYDDPYTEEELPEDVPYKVDKLYGDRIYKDGEVFYKDAKSGLYYRQGSQPRTQKFW